MTELAAHVGRALGWALFSSLWQSSLVALAAISARGGLRRGGAPSRYLALCAGLAAAFLWPVMTFLRSLAAQPTAASAGDWAAALNPILADRLHVALPFLALAWAVGVALHIVQTLGAWLCVQHWRVQTAVAVPPEWCDALARLRRKLATRVNVALVASRSTLGTVATVGWLRPVILIPVRTAAALPLQHIEAVLAHELAHILRRDYLVNLAQRAVEALMFYHPAVRWLSREIRAERENCCDDMAAEVCGDRLQYARALLALEQQRSASASLVMAAGGGDLSRRVGRLLGLRSGAGAPRAAWAVALPIAALALAAGVFARTTPSLHLLFAPTFGATASPAPKTAPGSTVEAPGISKRSVARNPRLLQLNAQQRPAPKPRLQTAGSLAGVRSRSAEAAAPRAHGSRTSATSALAELHAPLPAMVYAVAWHSGSPRAILVFTVTTGPGYASEAQSSDCTSPAWLGELPLGWPGVLAVNPAPSDDLPPYWLQAVISQT